MAFVCTLFLAGVVPAIGDSARYGAAEVQAASPKISSTKKSVKAGEQFTLKIQHAPKKAEIKWSSSDKSIATVEGNGASCKVTASKKNGGYVTVTAKVKKGKKTTSYKCNVNVQAFVITGKEANGIPPKTTITVKPGKTQTFLVKYTNYNNDYSDLDWSVTRRMDWDGKRKKLFSIKKINKNMALIKTEGNTGYGKIYIIDHNHVYGCDVYVRTPDMPKKNEAMEEFRSHY